MAKKIFGNTKIVINRENGLLEQPEGKVNFTELNIQNEITRVVN